MIFRKFYNNLLMRTILLGRPIFNPFIHLYFLRTTFIPWKELAVSSNDSISVEKIDRDLFEIEYSSDEEIMLTDEED